jgi:nucleoside-diphosphate-sugar epimerase
MSNQIHTVLGASGATGRAVIKELQSRNLKINAVTQSQNIEGLETIKANLLNEDEATKAIQNADYVYLCVGLPYQSKVWANDFPLLMQNVINACEKANAKLIFLDNIYMYASPLSLPFDEQEPQNPTSKKGRARKKTADLLLKAIAEKRIKAVIGRSADFYGEYTTNSALYSSFLQNMLKGKAPQVLGQENIIHTYAYSGNNGRALVALALDDSTYGQVWHLPVGKPITFDEVNSIMNRQLGTNFKISYVPKMMRKILGLFIPLIKEVEEMLYQFQQPYEMNFDKFKKQFPDFKVTSYEDGIRNMIQSFR